MKFHLIFLLAVASSVLATPIPNNGISTNLEERGNSNGFHNGNGVGNCNGGGNCNGVDNGNSFGSCDSATGGGCDCPFPLGSVARAKFC